ncbi:MAG: hypothetical protein HS117_25855 [Verrucomicrobiaceae bacterium]|jgi:hypothetical protein|nr:hypothetical protein [Verrucomicrobiaceae bacterium]
MKLTKKTRMPVDKLTHAHFEVFPVWEYASDEEGDEGMDETWVRPVSAKQVPADEYSQLVTATFTTANGRQFAGFMSVSPVCSTKKVLDHSGGTLFHGLQQCCLIDLNGPAIDFLKKECVDELENVLKLSSKEIFPLSFVLGTLIEGESKLRKGMFTAPPKSKSKKR